MELTWVELVIKNEIKQNLPQKSIAKTYRLALCSSWPTDWEKVNKMIIDKWSMSGLERVKKLAWSDL